MKRDGSENPYTVRPKSTAEVTKLDLANAVSDAGLVYVKQFPNLVELSLGMNVTDAGLKHLYGLKKLKRVRLPPVGVGVTEDGAKQLRAALPGCTVEK